MKKQIESFLYYMRYELNYSVHTVLSYQKDLEQFAAFASGDGDCEPKQVTQTLIRSWVYDLTQRRGLAVRSVRRKIQALRAFYKFLLKRGEVTTSPVDDIPMAKLPKHLPEFVGEKKMDEVLDADYDHRNFSSVRNHLMVAMLYETGMRRAELMSLKDADIDTLHCELKVHGKRNKDRVVPFCHELKGLIEEYRPLRQQLTVSDSEEFFLTDKGMPVYDKLVYNVVSEALGAVTSGKRSPHTLRHSYASAMLNHGAGINSVKELLGHESLAATQVYTHITYSEMKRNYKHAHPRALKKGG